MDRKAIILELLNLNKSMEKDIDICIATIQECAIARSKYAGGGGATAETLAEKDKKICENTMTLIRNAEKNYKSFLEKFVLESLNHPHFSDESSKSINPTLAQSL